MLEMRVRYLPVVLGDSRVLPVVRLNGLGYRRRGLLGSWALALLWKLSLARIRPLAKECGSLAVD